MQAKLPQYLEYAVARGDTGLVKVFQLAARVLRDDRPWRNCAPGPI